MSAHIIGRPNDDLLGIMLGDGVDPEQAFIRSSEQGREEGNGFEDHLPGDEPTVTELEGWPLPACAGWPARPSPSSSRPGQEEAIRAAVAGREVLAVPPTTPASRPSTSWPPSRPASIAPPWAARGRHSHSVLRRCQFGH